MPVTKQSSTSKNGKTGPTRLSLREEQKQLTRTRIVNAAVSVFFERGYAASTIDDVAAEAGIGRATFYLHFGSKAALVAEIGSTLMPELVRLYEELAALRNPTPDRVRAWIERFIGYYESQRALVGTCVQAETVEPDVSRGLAKNTAMLVDIVCRSSGATQASKAAEETRRSAAFLLVIQLDRFAYYQAVRGWAVNLQAGVTALASEWSTFLRSLSRP